jgi:hypothetical protein
MWSNAGVAAVITPVWAGNVGPNTMNRSSLGPGMAGKTEYIVEGMSPESPSNLRLTKPGASFTHRT